jgi:signal transduction histidine kinase
LVTLRESRQSAACEQEAGALYDDLIGGRWQLTSGQWNFYIQESRRCFHPDSNREAREGQASALAGGVEWLWNQWQRSRNGEGRSSGRSWLGDSTDDVSRNRPALVLWRSTPETLTGFVAGRSYVESEWGPSLRQIENRLSARFTLTDAEGNGVFGSEDRSAPIVHSFADSQIPWTLRTRSSDPSADLARLASRRHLFLAGLALTAVLIFMGGYFITRSLTRELEVARLQSDFVAAVSHEFRTPLASIRQASELLADGRVSSEQRRQAYYEALRTESERLQRLVENLLNFGRMEAGAEEYRFESLEAGTLVKDIAEEFGEKVREKGFLLETDTDPHLPRVRGDREALGIAVWNLLDNAVKYSPDSKRVWIETGTEGNAVAIRVRDEGVGIASAEQKEIFKKFVRLSAAKAAGIKGTGLGLAMAERIVNAHGGRIQVSSQPGAGSTFTILLPIGKDNGMEAPA